MMLWTAVFLTFCLVLVMFLLVFNAATYRQRSIAQRILTQTTSPEENVRRKKEPFSLKTMFKKASRIFVSRGIAVKAEADLIRAGIPLTGEEGLMLWLVMLIGVPALSLDSFPGCADCPVDDGAGGCGSLFHAQVCFRQADPTVRGADRQCPGDHGQLHAGGVQLYAGTGDCRP